MQIIPPGVRRMLAYLNASREQLDFENRLSGVSKGCLLYTSPSPRD